MFNFDNSNLYRVFIGLNDAETHKQEISDDDAMEIVKSYCYDHFEGATVSHGYGLYRHEDGTKVQESTIIVELFYIEDDDVKKFIEHVKYMLNQESIGLVKIPMKVTFA